MTPTVALTAVLRTAAPTTSAMTSCTRSRPLRNPIRVSRNHPRRASAVLPTAIAKARPIGTGVIEFARKAPTKTAGHTFLPKSSRAASEIPVGAHTGVALP